MMTYTLKVVEKKELVPYAITSFDKDAIINGIKISPDNVIIEKNFELFGFTNCAPNERNRVLVYEFTEDGIEEKYHSKDWDVLVAAAQVKKMNLK